jgi:hypothetical protein
VRYHGTYRNRNPAGRDPARRDRRAHGLSFEAWCIQNGITSSNARNATFGQSRGPKGRDMLRRIIDGAGRDFVMKAYVARIEAYAAQVKKRGVAS